VLHGSEIFKNEEFRKEAAKEALLFLEVFLFKINAGGGNRISVSVCNPLISNVKF
jgi:hypothetical protein